MQGRCRKNQTGSSGIGIGCFSEKGYAKATFDEIAARAGFTKGAVYWYFRNKADLVAALIIEYVGRKREELMPNVPEGNTLENLLEYFVLWADAGEKTCAFPGSTGL